MNYESTVKLRDFVEKGFKSDTNFGLAKIPNNIIHSIASLLENHSTLKTI
jgi:hypothetical protein